MNTRILLAVALAVSLLAGTAGAAAITGNPQTDGWTYAGNAMANGLYVRGDANYSYSVFTSVFKVTDSSVFSLSGHNTAAYSAYEYGWDVSAAADWNTGDTIIGVGGAFESITSAQAGWDYFTGGDVNYLLSNTLKLQAKFGTADAAWSTSTVAPSQGDGSGSGSVSGAGGVQVRTSAYLGNAWSTYAGQIMGLQKSSHISKIGADSSSYPTPSANAVRLIWDFDNAVASWQILLNVTMLNSGIEPGNPILTTVQNGDGKYTDALVYSSAGVVPEPATMTLLGLGLGGLALSRVRRRKAA